MVDSVVFNLERPPTEDDDRRVVVSASISFGANPTCARTLANASSSPSRSSAPREDAPKEAAAAAVDVATPEVIDPNALGAHENAAFAGHD